MCIYIYIQFDLNPMNIHKHYDFPVLSKSYIQKHDGFPYKLRLSSDVFWFSFTPWMLYCTYIAQKTKLSASN